MAYIGQAPSTIVSENTFDEFNFTATSNQTTFTGVDADGKTLVYNPGNLEVFLNGVRLEEADFTATNGTSVVLAIGATTGDVMSVKSFSAFQVGDAVSKASGGAFGGNISVTGTVTATSYSGDGSSLSGISTDVVGDITPQLGGNLDLNSKNISGTGNIDITGFININQSSGTTLFKTSVAANSTVGFEINKTGSTTQSWQIADGVTHNGALQFYDVTDAAVRMHIDGDGRVGFGMTPDPAVKVSFSGSIGTTNGTDAAPTHTFYSDSDTGMYRVGANTLGFVTGATDALTIDSSQHATFNADIIAKKHLRLYTTDDQAHQWYVYNHTDDTLRFNYDGAGNDEAIFYTNGNIDFATNQTTAVRINSNARTNTGLNVGGASSTATGIYVDNSDGSATLDIAVLGSSYGSHGASAGEVWFYSPDNINIGGATGSSNTINLLGGGRKNIEFRNNGVVFYPEVGNQGDMTFPICSVSNNGSGGQYMHVQFQAQGGDMLHIHFLGYDYGGRYRSGGAGGYIYNTANQASLYSSAVSGHCVAVYQNIQNRVELVIDTGAGGTGNRWGSYLFFGGTDTITGNSPLTLTQYTWNGSTGRQY